MANYYDVLGCDESSSYEELKECYKALVLKHHPDKDGSNVSFQALDEAWKTLRDPIEREKYNGSLRRAEIDCQDLLYGTYSLDQLDCQDGVFSCTCRCGGSYNFEKNELDSSCLISCDECSLKIQVK